MQRTYKNRLFYPKQEYIYLLIISFCYRKQPKTPFYSTLPQQSVENFQFSATMISTLFTITHISILTSDIQSYFFK